MNTMALIKKLQRAILGKGLIIKTGTSQFYSQEQNRFVTMYIISTSTYTQIRGKWKEKNYEILRTASVIEVITCLAEIWNSMKEWGSEK